jgi:DNA-binding transcriptional LysR family regulator
MDTINSMRIFSRVAETASFTLAARALGITTAQTSRVISDLETHLRTRLLNRSTRKISVTEAGERFLVRCQIILSELEQAEAEARDAYATPTGRLKLHSMTNFGIQYVVPLIAAYSKQFPTVDIDLTLQQRAPDILEEGYDVSLVLAAELPDSNFISQRLGTSYSIACASPDYLERMGKPEAIADLHAHHCLQLAMPGGAADKWVFEGHESDAKETFKLPPSRLRVNLAEALAVALVSGMGIGVLPKASVKSELANGKLIRVLPDYRLDVRNIYAIYASRQYLAAKTRSWIDFLKDALPPLLDSGPSPIDAA